MQSVDTNILVRLIARDDDSQTVAAEKFVEQGAWVSVLALAEAVWVFGAVYGKGHEDQVQAIEMLLRHRDLVLQDADSVGVALETFRDHPSLGFSDCLILAVARKNGHVPFGTFDRKLAKLPGAKKL